MTDELTNPPPKMTDEPMKIDEMIKKLQNGQIEPGSKQGLDAIRQIAMRNPMDIVLKLYAVPNDILEHGLRAAGLSENDIEDLLSKQEQNQNPADPFSSQDKQQKDEPETDLSSDNPMEFNPAKEILGGPKRF